MGGEVGTPSDLEQGTCPQLFTGAPDLLWRLCIPKVFGSKELSLRNVCRHLLNLKWRLSDSSPGLPPTASSQSGSSWVGTALSAFWFWAIFLPVSGMEVEVGFLCLHHLLSHPSFPFPESSILELKGKHNRPYSKHLSDAGS